MKNKFCISIISIALLTSCASIHAPDYQMSNRSLASNCPAVSSVELSDSAPCLLSGKAPVFPIGLMLSGAKGETGEATISFTITEQGSTKDFKVVSAKNVVYANHIIIAVREWRFRPAMHNGVAQESQYTQSYTFEVGN